MIANFLYVHALPCRNCSVLMQVQIAVQLNLAGIQPAIQASC